MDTKTEICNLALRHMGTGNQIASLTEKSLEAQVLSDLFDRWMGTVLRGFNWNFATVYLNMEPIQIFPNQVWKFSYRRPSDCLFFQKFWNGRHNDNEDDVVHYVFSSDAQGGLILTDWGPPSALTAPSTVATQPFFPPTNQFTIAPGDIVPVGIYTKIFSALVFVPDDFRWAFSLMLAGWAAPSLPNVGVVDLRKSNLELGSSMMEGAMARDANEARPTLELISSLAKSRRGSRMDMTQAGWAAFPESFVN